MQHHNSRLSTAVHSLRHSLNGFGVSSQTAKPFEHLKDSTDYDFQDAAALAIQRYIQVIGTPVPDQTDRERDLAHLKRFLKIACLKFVDPSFMDRFQSGDMIEVYSASHQQIFRNVGFFRLCGYDLYTLAVTPWHLLFKRPDAIQDQLLNTAEYLLLKAAPIILRPVPTHIIQESHGGHSQSFIYTTRMAGCLVDEFTLEPKAYISVINIVKLEGKNDIAHVN